MDGNLYKAVARSAYGDIEQGATVSFNSEREVDQSTGLSFRHEIAEACREQLGATVGEDEEARLAMNFDVYSEARYEETVRPKLEAAAEKERQRQEREAERGSRSKKKGSKKSKSSAKIGKLTLAQWKRLLKFLLGVIVVIWFFSTQVKSCSLNDLWTQARDTVEEMAKTTTKKSTSTKKTSTTKKKTTAKKASTTKRSTTAKKTAAKKTTATKKSTAKKSTTKKSTTKKSSSKKTSTKKSTKKNS